MHTGAMPGLRQAYTQSMNIVIRKELRLYASSLRKAASASSVTNAAEPDMGMAHKRVSLPLPFHPLHHLCNIFLTTNCGELMCMAFPARCDQQ